MTGEILHWKADHSHLAKTTAMPYITLVQTVIETRAFLSAARDAGMSDNEREALLTLIAGNPVAGVLIPGTNGCRKLRYRKPGSGKSGGYRVVSFFGGFDIPVVLLTVFGKNEKANLTQAERNRLAALSRQLETELRKALR